MPLRACLVLLAACSLAACSSPKEPSAGGAGSESFGCLEVASTELEMGEATPLGFSGADLLALAGGEHAETLAWSKGGETALAITVEHAGGRARYVERAWKDDGSGREIAADCPNLVEVDVNMKFVTEDGAFAETFAVPLQASTKDEASASATREISAIEGSYEVTEIDMSDKDGANLFFDVTFDASGARGAVSGQATATHGDPSDPEAAVSVQAFQVGSL